MKLTSGRMIALAVNVWGMLLVAWGVQHPDDPVAVRDYKGYPMPGRDQFVAIPFGAALICTGTSLWRFD